MMSLLSHFGSHVDFMIYMYIWYLIACKCLIVELQHPVLVDPVTGIVQMITVLKNFPHMTKDYVRVVYMCF